MFGAGEYDVWCKIDLMYDSQGLMHLLFVHKAEHSLEHWSIDDSTLVEFDPVGFVRHGQRLNFKWSCPKIWSSTHSHLPKLDPCSS